MIFLPSPENKDYKHLNKPGRILFKEMKGSRWYIELEETMWLRKDSPLQKEVNIKVLGLVGEFKIIKKEKESAQP